MAVRAVEIGGRRVGDGLPCFIVAEAGVNHNGSLENALALVDIAHAAGADCVKFQLYQPIEQVSHVAQVVDYQHRQTGSASMLKMAESYDLPWEAHHAIARRCRELGILYLASCFDEQAVDFLVALGGECIKVASGEITNYPLLRHVASSGKPVLLSTGMSTLQDVAGAVGCLRNSGNRELVLLQCSSAYPADPATANLRVMQSLAQAFGTPTGFSDHTTGSVAAVAAVALGACVVEKHFTLNKALPGPDHAMSLDPSELRSFVSAIRTTEAALGDGIKCVHPSEMAVHAAARRSIVSRRQIPRGVPLDRTNTTLKRPATGIDPRLLDAVLGRIAAVDIPEDVPITWEMLA